MAAIAFENIPGTRLYEPVSPAANEALLFLDTTPSSSNSVLSPVTLDKTWDGKPVGYYLFLKKLPDNFSKFQEEAERVLDVPAQPPQHSSFAWLGWKADAATVKAKILIKPAVSGDPVAAEDVAISIPGIPGIHIPAATPVVGEKDDEGNLNAFSFAYPPQPAHDGQPASDPPWASGTVVPMAGNYAGCLKFQALLNAGNSSGNPIRKQVALVSLDPVRPTDSQRTRISLTGVLLNLGQLPSGAFYLEPANA